MIKKITTLLSIFTVTYAYSTEITKCIVDDNDGNLFDGKYHATVVTIGATEENGQILDLNSSFTLSKENSSSEYTGGNALVVAIGNGTNFISSKGDAFISITIDATYLEKISAKALSNFTNVTTFTIKGTNITPPSITETSFPEEWLTTCELVVPDEALEAYKASEWVKYFYKINGEIIDHTTTAIGDNEVEKLNITTTNNTIRLNENVDVVVYSITGQQIYNGTTDVVTVPNSGIYIVKTNATTQKIMVK